MNHHQAIEALGALAQDTRLRVFRLLVKAGEGGLPAGEIATALDTRQNTLSSHLAILTRAALVSKHREGRVIRYRANYTGMRGLLRFLMDDCCQGDAAICAPLARAQA